MRVWNLHPFQHTLHTAILAPSTMQRVEDRIGLHTLQFGNEIGARINLNNPIAHLPQGGGAFLTCRQGDRALRA
jgi:hypothetical protein